MLFFRRRAGMRLLPWRWIWLASIPSRRRLARSRVHPRLALRTALVIPHLAITVVTVIAILVIPVLVLEAGVATPLVSSRRSSLRWRSERTESLISAIGSRRSYTRLSRRHRWSVIFPARSPCSNDGTSTEIPRPRRRGDSGAPVVLSRKVLAILDRHMFVLGLRRQRSHMLLASPSLFLLSRTRLKAARPAVIGDMVLVDDDRAVVNVRHVRHAHVGHSAVIVETTAAPLSARESYATIAKTVVDASIETDMWPPISCVPRIESPAPAPVSGRPVHADGRHDPGAGHPVIAAVVIPGPIAWRPKIARTRTNRLRVNRDRWRSEADRTSHRNLPERRSSQRQHNHR